MVWHRGMKKKYKKLLDITYINYESLNTDFLTETVWLSHIQIYQRIQVLSYTILRFYRNLEKTEAGTAFYNNGSLFELYNSRNRKWGTSARSGTIRMHCVLHYKMFTHVSVASQSWFWNMTENHLLDSFSSGNQFSL